MTLSIDDDCLFTFFFSSFIFRYGNTHSETSLCAQQTTKSENRLRLPGWASNEPDMIRVSDDTHARLHAALCTDRRLPRRSRGLVHSGQVLVLDEHCCALIRVLQGAFVVSDRGRRVKMGEQARELSYLVFGVCEQSLERTVL